MFLLGLRLNIFKYNPTTDKTDKIYWNHGRNETVGRLSCWKNIDFYGDRQNSQTCTYWQAII